jgi:hypothetical protein
MLLFLVVVPLSGLAWLGLRAIGDPGLYSMTPKEFSVGLGIVCGLTAFAGVISLVLFEVGLLRLDALELEQDNEAELDETGP